MPVAKITKSVVDSLPLTTKGQVNYCDRDLPGFYVIVGMKTKTYVAQKDISGRSVRYTIGRHGVFTPEEARKIAKEKLHLMGQGINPNEQEAQARAKAVTLYSVLDSYLKTRRGLKERTRTDYRYHIDKYLPDWGNKFMTDITKEMVSSRHAVIAEKSGPTTANKVMRILRALFNHTHATYDICPVNPVMYLTKAKGWFKETRKRTYIKPHDLKKWWDAVHGLENDTYRDFFLLLLFTGLRRNEAAALKWADIDFNDKTFTIPETKNGDPLTLPMCDYVFEMLMERKRLYDNHFQIETLSLSKRGEGSVYVFPGPGINGYLAEPKKGVNAVIKASGVKFSCHDMRRTFITIAESLDLSGYALKRLLNHRVTDVTGGYIIIDVTRLRGPVDKVAAFILEKIGYGSEGESNPQYD